MRRARSRARSSVAAVTLAMTAVGVLVYIAHAALVPIALSLLFALLLSAPVEALNRHGLPRSVSALMILLLFLTLVGTTVDLLWAPAQSWVESAPRTVQVIQRKIGPAAKFLDRIEALSARAAHLADPKKAEATQAAAPPDPGTPGTLAQTQELLLGGLTILILTLFLLATGPSVLARMSASFATNVHATQVLKVIEAVRGEVGRYYATIALINLGLGIATATVMMALGMPNPVLWGCMAALFNFIPYVGSTATFAIVTTVAFVSFDSIGQVLAVGGSYLALATIEGQVVQPLLVGNRLELNPIIVFLAVWFGGWFWGIPGIVLAVPSLVALKVAAEHHKRGDPLLQFLSPSGDKAAKASRLSIRRNRPPAAASVIAP
jgi:predicted PurR-regulated permease PerM